MNDSRSNGGTLARIAGGALATIIVTACIAAAGFTYSTREDLAEIRIAQATALGEVRILAERIEALRREYDDLRRRVDEMERSRR